MATKQSDVLVIGGGLAGIVTALECLRAGRRVILVDRDTPERFGGLALWAFGGMALVGTPLQARMKIPDTPEVAPAPVDSNRARTHAITSSSDHISGAANQPAEPSASGPHTCAPRSRSSRAQA